MLSIVIPTFNEQDYLPRLLASIRSQGFSDYELIVADNFSTDATRDIARRFEARVVDGGAHPGVGRNRGAEAARGDLILFLDADVILPDIDWLERKLRQFDRRKLDAATCLIKPISDRRIDTVTHSIYNAHMLAMQFLHEHAPGFCLFSRMKLHHRIGGFDESVKLAEDHDYVRRAVEFGKFRVLYGARIHVSVRRMDRDGRFNIVKKFLKAELYNLALGPIRDDSFEYTFGHDTRGKENPARQSR
jgi:glycosyltransferase involved in cell wall biosynthesis